MVGKKRRHGERGRGSCYVLKSYKELEMPQHGDPIARGSPGIAKRKRGCRKRRRELP